MKPGVETYRVRIVGKRPLLMHQIPVTLGDRGRSGVRVSAEEEAKAGLYRDASGVIALPSLNIKAAIRDEGRAYRVPGRGRVSFKDFIKSGIEIEPQMVRLKVPDGKDPENSWKVDLRPVLVQRARIMRARPKFDQWELEFTVNILDALITPDQLKEIIKGAGSHAGLGDFRPEFGLFELTGFEKC